MTTPTRNVCRACGLRTRANLPSCPECGGAFYEEALAPDEVPSAGQRLERRILDRDWLRIVFTVLASVVVIGDSVALIGMREDPPLVLLALAITGVAFPVLFYFVPATLEVLRFRGLETPDRTYGRPLPFRYVLFVGMLLPLFGLNSSGISSTAVLCLVGSYLVYLVTLWIVQDRTLGPDVAPPRRFTHDLSARPWSDDEERG